MDKAAANFLAGSPALAVSRTNRVFEPLPAGPSPASSLRICIISPEVAGPTSADLGIAYAELSQSLARHGHRVTLILASPCSAKDSTSSWKEHYKRRGVEFICLPEDGRLDVSTSMNMSLSRQVHQWLKRRRFDLVHMPESSGLAYYALLAKMQGLYYHDTTFCIGIQNPTVWHKTANRQYLNTVDDLIADYMERRCVALADICIGASEYILRWAEKEAWSFPEQTYIQPNIMSGALVSNAAKHQIRRSAIDEIVFFGRLEERKGLSLFCDAIDRIQPQLSSNIQITFLGEETLTNGLRTRDFLETRAAAWKLKTRLLGSFSHARSLAYLRKRPCLPVMPSLDENDAYTIRKCMALGIPFLTTAVGGTAEILDLESRNRVLIEPSADSLARHLLLFLEKPQSCAIPLRSDKEIEQQWLDWHSGIPDKHLPRAVDEASHTQPLVSVCMSTYNRSDTVLKAIASLEQQTYSNLEVILINDGSNDPEALDTLKQLEPTFLSRGWKLLHQDNSGLGAARNTAVRHAAGKYILFMDDDNIAKPHELETFIKIAEKTGADILTCFADRFSSLEQVANNSPQEQSLYLGAAASVGVFLNVFGDANALLRRDTFLRLGGFTTDKLAFEDWEFFARAVLAGAKLEVIPEALFWYRISPDSLSSQHSQFANRMRALRATIGSVDVQLKPMVEHAVAMWVDEHGDGSFGGRQKERKDLAEIIDLNIRTIEELEEELRVLIGSVSWKYTRYLRELKLRFLGRESRCDRSTNVLDTDGTIVSQIKAQYQYISYLWAELHAIQASLSWLISSPLRLFEKRGGNA